MPQLKFLEVKIEPSLREVRINQFIRGVFFTSQTVLLSILILLTFFDFWNISNRGTMVWLPLILTLFVSAIMIFCLVSIKNEVEEANNWYTITCTTLILLLIIYLFFLNHIIPINKPDAYLFSPFSPYRDDWSEESYYYEANFQSPKDFPFAFWFGATIEGILGPPAGQVILAIVIILIILLFIGAILSYILPKRTNKRMSAMIEV